MEVQEKLSVEEKSIEAIKNILSRAKASKIYYIDDKFDIDNQRDEFIGYCKSIKNKKDQQSKLKFITINWKQANSAFIASLTKIWKGANDTLKNQIISAITENQIDYVSVNKLSQYLSNVFGVLSPKEWENKKSDILKGLNQNNKIICLFDYDLNEKRKGTEYVKQLLSSNPENIYCGILTQMTTPENEQEKKKEFEITVGQKYFHVISKQRISEDSTITGFSNGIKNVILIKHVEELKENSINIFTESLEKVKAKFDDLLPSTFNSIVQKTSFEESIWEIDTFFRLTNILIDQETKKCIADKDKIIQFNQSVKNIRNIEEIETLNPDVFKNPQVEDLREQELYFDGSIINQLHYPLHNGDIFNIKNKEYILLSQPCNLTIRKNGKRDFNYNRTFLLELKDFKADSNITNNIYQLKTANGHGKVVKFPDYKVACLSILDLVVFNDAGEAKICFGQALESEILHTSLTNRYNYILEELKKYKNILLAFESKTRNKTNSRKNLELIKNYIKIPLYMTDFKIDGIAAYNNKNDEFNFPIRRIRQYKSEYAMDLLKNFMAYLSRTGFEREFEQ